MSRKQSKKPSVPKSSDESEGYPPYFLSMGHTHMDVDRMFSYLSEEIMNETKKSVFKGPPGHAKCEPDRTFANIANKLKKSVLLSLMNKLKE